MNRVLSVAQIQLITWRQTFGWPIAVVATSFAINLAAFASVTQINGQDQVTGGVVSMFVCQLIVCSLLIAQTFSFAVGFNVTRRAFFWASCLIVAVQSTVFAVLLYILSIVELYSGGWGLRMTYFTVVPVTRGYSPLSVIAFGVPMLLVSILGFALGAIAVRWGANGVLACVTVAVVGLGGAAVAITGLDRWATIGQWFAGQSGLALTAGWTLIPLALFAIVSYGVIRRANP